MELTQELEQELEYVEGKKPSVFKRILLVLLTTAILLGSAAYAAGYILFKGPSEYLSHQAVRALADDSVGHVVLRMYLSESEIDRVLSVEEGAEQFSAFPTAG